MSEPWPSSLCATCHAPLRDGLARVSDAGWVCAPRCNLAALRRHKAAQAAAERLEDLVWMTETGESLSGAASRLGITAPILERWLQKHGRHDLCRRLTSREGVRRWAS